MKLARTFLFAIVALFLISQSPDARSEATGLNGGTEGGSQQTSGSGKGKQSVIDASTLKKMEDTVPKYLETVDRTKASNQQQLEAAGDKLMSSRPKYYMNDTPASAMITYTAKEVANYMSCNGVEDANRKKTLSNTTAQLFIPAYQQDICLCAYYVCSKFIHYGFWGAPTGIAISKPRAPKNADEAECSSGVAVVVFDMPDLVEYFFPSQVDTSSLNVKANRMKTKTVLEQGLNQNKTLFKQVSALTESSVKMTGQLTDMTVKILTGSGIQKSDAKLSEDSKKLVNSMADLSNDQLFNSPNAREGTGYVNFETWDLLTKRSKNVPHVSKRSFFDKGTGYGFMFSHGSAMSLNTSFLTMSSALSGMSSARRNRYLKFQLPFGMFQQCFSDKKVDRPATQQYPGGQRAPDDMLGASIANPFGIARQADGGCLPNVGRILYPLTTNVGNISYSDSSFHGFQNTKELYDILQQSSLVVAGHSYWPNVDRSYGLEGDVALATKGCEIRKGIGIRPWDLPGGDKRALNDASYNAWVNYEDFLGPIAFKGETDWMVKIFYGVDRVIKELRMDEKKKAKDYSGQGEGSNGNGGQQVPQNGSNA